MALDSALDYYLQVFCAHSPAHHFFVTSHFSQNLGYLLSNEYVSRLVYELALIVPNILFISFRSSGNAAKVYIAVYNFRECIVAAAIYASGEFVCLTNISLNNLNFLFSEYYSNTRFEEEITFSAIQTLASTVHYLGSSFYR